MGFSGRINNNNNNVHLSCAHQNHERSLDTYTHVEHSQQPIQYGTEL